MSKSNWITFGISVVVLATIVVIALMILLPQQSVVLDASSIKYEGIKKSDYVYEQTKDITRDALVKEYTITSEQMDKFKDNKQYVSGNSDPFTPGGSSLNTTGTNNSNSNTSVSDNTTDKITNSNGGTPNPPSTNK